MITIAFSDFWPGFDSCSNFITETLSRKFEYTVVHPEDGPDILFYSCFGRSHLKFPNSIRVFYTGENDVPNFNQCDYAISFHHIDFGKRHLRLPLYVFHNDVFNHLRDGKRIEVKQPAKRAFCSAVISNNRSADSFRSSFMEALNGYKTVASGGRYANNVGGPVADKWSFISGYKFNLAIENSSVEGYTTEKIVDPFLAGTVPIYWGNPRVVEDFNPEAFVNLHDFSSMDSMLSYIKALDADDERYLKMLAADPMKKTPFMNWEDQLLNFLSNIVLSSRSYVCHYGKMGIDYERAVCEDELYSIQFFKKHVRLFQKAASFKKHLW